MKKFLIILLFISFSLSGCNNNSPNTQESNNSYNISRINTTHTTNINNSEENNNSLNNSKSLDTTNSETEISSFSTKIYTPNDENRQSNIRITCSKLNQTIVKSR